jgi:hypothetical protein
MAYNEGYTTAEVTSICIGNNRNIAYYLFQKTKNKTRLKASKQKNIFLTDAGWNIIGMIQYFHYLSKYIPVH